MKNPAHNIYIHVPFCMSKCNYCAFFSRACANPDWTEYTDGICREIATWSEKLGRISVPTIFLGGGTPSLMPVVAFEKIMTQIHHYFDVMQDAEITLESNPGTLTAERLRDFVAAGVNRLSVGVQSLSDEKLQFLGRRHSVADAIKLLNLAHDMGLRVSADFIYGLPGDNADSVRNLCERINKLGLQHCSLYELTIESNTPFGKMNLAMPDNDTMAQMYTTIGDVLNLPRYEVSNYAAPNNECRHNQNIWDGAAYIGLGRAAAGRVNIADTWYEQLGANARFEQISPAMRATEMLITGMRTMRGCRLTDDVKNVIDMNWVKSNSDLVRLDETRIRATNQGLLILDDVLVKLVK